MANIAPTWLQLGAQNGSKIDEKLMKKGIISWTWFLIIFLLILGASCVDFWWIWGAKLRAKLTEKSIIWPLVGQFAEIAKKIKNPRKIKVF